MAACNEQDVLFPCRNKRHNDLGVGMLYMINSERLLVDTMI